jgi:hypothetical protein
MGIPEFCFVSGPGGSVFMDELLDVAADAVRRAGGHTRSAVGRFPEPTANTVYVIVPHEYFILMPPHQQPSAELLARTIGFCVEHPGNLSFERTAQALPRLACGVDINVDSTAELRRRGNRVEHFQLGYSPLWDRWGGDLDSKRTTDVTYLGTEERRRSRLLASYWRELEHLSTRLLTPPHEMMGPPRVDFLIGQAKFDHLATSRFLINLHRGQSTALEWVRVLEALCNGCVVLTEPATDLPPLVSGEHLLSARAESLASIAAALATDSSRERELRAAGYEFVHKRLNLLGSAAMLIDLGSELVSGTATPPQKIASRLGDTPRTPAESISTETPSWDTRFAPGPAGPQGSSDPQSCALAVDRFHNARRETKGVWVNGSGLSVFPERHRAPVDVVLVQSTGESDPSDLIDDLLVGTLLPQRILVGVDGTSHDRRPRGYDRLIHEFRLGLGYTRNALLRRSQAHWVLVLDTGMRASKYLLERFTSVTEETAVVHCPIGDPVAGLVGALPPQAHRLLRLPYLGSGYLVRRSLLEKMGGWTSDPLLDGLEDHVFWRQLVEDDVKTNLVQQVLLHRDRPDPPMRPLDLDPQHVWSLANGSAILHTA